MNDWFRAFTLKVQILDGFFPVQRQARATTRLALSLLAGAGVLWSVVLWRAAQEAPVQDRITQATQLLQKGQIGDAEAKLREAVKIAPDNVACLELLGDLYWRANNFKKAQPVLERLLQLEPDSAEVRMRLAQSALKNGNTDSARQLAEEQLVRTPDNVPALEMLADFDKQEGQSGKRLEHLKRLVELQPQNASVLRDLVDELEAQGSFAQAIAFADRLVQLEPQLPSSYYLRGIALYTVNSDEKMLARAKADFQKIVQMNPNDPEGHRFLGRIYMRHNEPQKAISQFEAIGRGRPFASVHYLEMAQAYRRVGNTRRADELQGLFTRIKVFNSRIEDGREQLHVHPSSVPSLLNMAMIISQGTRGEDAFFQLLRFRLLQGRLQSASFYLHKALALNPKNAEVRTAMEKSDVQSANFCRIALRALQSGNSSKARASIFRAVLLRPEVPLTRRTLKEFTTRGIDPIGTLPPPPASTLGLVSPTK